MGAGNGSFSFTKMGVKTMWGSTDTLEMKIEVEKKLNEFEEMLKMAFPKLYECPDKSVKEYAEKKIDEIGCKDTPCSDMYDYEEFKMLTDLSKNDRITAVFHALAIGFASGVKWERKCKCEISSETIGKAAADYAKEYTMRTGKNPYDFT